MNDTPEPDALHIMQGQLDASDRRICEALGMSEVNHAEALNVIDGMKLQIERLVKLLLEANDMWAFSRANEARGHYDCDWNAKRIALLSELTKAESK